jgi:hypothetical protein
MHDVDREQIEKESQPTPTFHAIHLEPLLAFEL